METIGNINNFSPRFSESENLSGLRAIADNCWRAVNFIEIPKKSGTNQKREQKPCQMWQNTNWGQRASRFGFFFSNRGLGWSFGDEEHDELAEIRLRAHAA